MAASKKIVGWCRPVLWLGSGAAGGALPALCRCILMQFSRLFSVLYTVHIHTVSYKASVFNGFAVFVIR